MKNTSVTIFFFQEPLTFSNHVYDRVCVCVCVCVFIPNSYQVSYHSDEVNNNK